MDFFCESGGDRIFCGREGPVGAGLASDGEPCIAEASAGARDDATLLERSKRFSGTGFLQRQITFGLAAKQIPPPAAAGSE